MRMIDIPPVWLALCLALTWVSPWDFPWGNLPWVGRSLVGIGVLLIGAAVLAFRQSRTTVIPHQNPTALVAHGIFRISRNPIYLADLLILAGLALSWGKPVGLALVPVLFLILERRFILAEEARLEKAFGQSFADYRKTTRRWL